ncbi:MAG: putative molybdenum carrier protein [Pseudomonadota bacterium]
METKLNFIEKIVSGAQTGVDRAALDVAMKLGIAHGGWVPKNRLAEDGEIDNKYNVKETNTSDYAHRTIQNIINSDATLILSKGKISGGSAYTLFKAKEHKKPVLWLKINKNQDRAIVKICQWLNENKPKILNLAGPRESKEPGIYDVSFDFLIRLFSNNF